MKLIATLVLVMLVATHTVSQPTVCSDTSEASCGVESSDSIPIVPSTWCAITLDGQVVRAVSTTNISFQFNNDEKKTCRGHTKSGEFSFAKNNNSVMNLELDVECLQQLTTTFPTQPTTMVTMDGDGLMFLGWRKVNKRSIGVSMTLSKAACGHQERPTTNASSLVPRPGAERSYIAMRGHDDDSHQWYATFDFHTLPYPTMNLSIVNRSTGAPTQTIVAAGGHIELINETVVKDSLTILRPWLTALGALQRGFSYVMGVEVNDGKQLKFMAPYTQKPPVGVLSPMSFFHHTAMCAASINGLSFSMTLSAESGTLRFREPLFGCDTGDLPFTGIWNNNETTAYFNNSAVLRCTKRDPEYQNAKAVTATINGSSVILAFTNAETGSKMKNLVFSSQCAYQNITLNGTYCYTSKHNTWRLFLSNETAHMFPSGAAHIGVRNVSLHSPIAASKASDSDDVFLIDNFQLWKQRWKPLLPQPSTGSVFIRATALPGDYIEFYDTSGLPVRFSASMCEAVVCPHIEPTVTKANDKENDGLFFSRSQQISVEWAPCGTTGALWSHSFAFAGGVVPATNLMKHTPKDMGNAAWKPLDSTCAPVCSNPTAGNCTAIAAQVGQTAACYISNGEKPSTSNYLRSILPATHCEEGEQSLQAATRTVLNDAANVQPICVDGSDSAVLLVKGTNVSLVKGGRGRCVQGITVSCSPCMYYFAPHVTATPYLFLGIGVLKNLLIIIAVTVLLRKHLGMLVATQLSHLYIYLFAPRSTPRKAREALRKQIFFTILTKNADKEEFVNDFKFICGPEKDEYDLDVTSLELLRLYWVLVTHRGRRRVLLYEDDDSGKEVLCQDNLDAIRKVLRTAVRFGATQPLGNTERKSTRTSISTVELSVIFDAQDSDQQLEQAIEKSQHRFVAPPPRSSRAAIPDDDEDESDSLQHMGEQEEDDANDTAQLTEEDTTVLVGQAAQSISEMLQKDVVFYPCLEHSLYIPSQILEPPAAVLWLQLMCNVLILCYFIFDTAVRVDSLGLDPFKRMEIVYLRFFNTASCFTLLVDSLLRYTSLFLSFNPGTRWIHVLKSLLPRIQWRRRRSLTSGDETAKAFEALRKGNAHKYTNPPRSFIIMSLLLLLPGLPNVVVGSVIFIPITLMYILFIAALIFFAKRMNVATVNTRGIVIMALVRLLITFIATCMLQSAFNYSALLLDAMSPSHDSAFKSAFADIDPEDPYGSTMTRVFETSSGWPNVISREFNSRSLLCAWDALQRDVSRIQMIINF